MDKHLNDADRDKVIGEGTMIGPETVQQLFRQKSDIRIYGYLRFGDGAGQVIRVYSQERFDEVNEDVQFYFVGADEVKISVIAPGWRPPVTSELEDEPVRLYLACDGCGEVFDEIATAYAHESAPECIWRQGHTYSIKTEDEAF